MAQKTDLIDAYYGTMGTGDDLAQLEAQANLMEGYAHEETDLPPDIAIAIETRLRELLHIKQNEGKARRPTDPPSIEDLKKDAVRYLVHANTAGVRGLQKEIADAYGLPYDTNKNECYTLKTWVRKYRDAFQAETPPDEEALNWLKEIMSSSGKHFQKNKPAGTGNRTKPVNNPPTS